jgi:hypothetical protein
LKAYACFWHSNVVSLLNNQQINTIMDSTNTWNDDYQQQLNKIARLKETYYDFEGKLALPVHSRYYYDYLSSQSKSRSIDDKLRDLGFLVCNGFDLFADIQNYKYNREEYITSVIPDTFIQYILFMRHGVYIHATTNLLKKLSEKEIIQLFEDEIKLRYNSREHSLETFTWKLEKLVEIANHDKNIFFNQLYSAGMTRYSLVK